MFPSTVPILTPSQCVGSTAKPVCWDRILTREIVTREVIAKHESIIKVFRSMKKLPKCMWLAFKEEQNELQ
jgi:hypothetical protein